MTNPFILDVRNIATGLSEQVDASGPSPVRWGGEMFAVAEGSPVEVHGLLNNFGEVIMVDAAVEGTANLTCAVCLSERNTPVSVHINDVFGFSPDFIRLAEDSANGSKAANGSADAHGSSDIDDAEETLLVDNDTIDITQLVINEAGLNAPFSPVCADFGFECADTVPKPDGESKDQGNKNSDTTDAKAIDPRWAGLEKFK